ELLKLKEAPLAGYGYDIEGQIFQDRRFTSWEEVWDAGPASSLHNGYLSMAIGIGIPATIAWIVIVLAPWAWLMRRESDPWNLKPLLFLVIVPTFICGTAESVLGDPHNPLGILFFIGWMLAERYRFKVEAAERAREPKLRQPPLVAALSRS